MVDALRKMRDMLVANGAVNALAGSNVFAGEAEWPRSSGFAFGDYGVVFMGTGGTHHYEHAAVIPRLQIKCYGQTPVAANAINRAVFDCLEQDKTYWVMACTLESGPIDLREPETDQPYVLSFWRVVVRNA